MKSLLLALLLIAVALAAPLTVFSQISADVRGLKEFEDRVEAYEKLHKGAEKSLPPFKKKSNQEAIAAHQKALLTRIRESRGNARQGDIFTPGATHTFARAIQAVFTGPDAHRVENTIQAGTPLAGFEVQVNQKYPDGLPYTTLPPSLLRKLPTLPDEVAYRLLGSTLLLVDRQANMIVDFMPNAIP